MEITLAQFKAYEAVRKSGAVSMSISRHVAVLAHLPLEVVRTIQKEYGQLVEKWRREI